MPKYRRKHTLTMKVVRRNRLCEQHKESLYQQISMMLAQSQLRGSVPKNGPIDFASQNHFSLNSADGKGLVPKY